MAEFDADFLIVGSGFGGAVSALRLADKGYRVVVLEAGRRYRPEDFPQTNWSLSKYLWAPKLRCFGIQRMTYLTDVFVLSGAGVGGGSLVYANTLLVPPASFFRDSAWCDLADWETLLKPHYEEALRMLGASRSRFMGPGDEALREVADDLGRGHTFHQPDVGVFQGSPGVTVPDPYFGGEGPARTGCVHCGGCMVGCRYGAKNSLDQNYLYLAEKRGAQVIPDTRVEGLWPHRDGGYEVLSRPSGAFALRPSKKRRWRVRQVVLAAGVLGTVPLLLRCRQKGWLPHLSAALGSNVRTNSEAVVGVTERSGLRDHSRGLAITSGFYADDETHIELVRYGKGQDAMGRLSTVMADGHRWFPRFCDYVRRVVRHPVDFLRSLWPFGWARKTAILLVMQPCDSALRLELERRWWCPWTSRPRTRAAANQPRIPTYIPAANEVAKRLAVKLGGYPISAIHEAFFNIPTTAHILGGCPMAATSEHGVIDPFHRVHGYPGLYVCDGSAVAANLGVNPALTITALTELAMSRIPDRGGA